MSTALTRPPKHVARPILETNQCTLNQLQITELPVRSKQKKSKSKKNISRSSSKRRNKTKKTPQKSNLVMKNTHKVLSRHMIEKQECDNTRNISNDKTKKNGKAFVRTSQEKNHRERCKRNSKKSVDSENEETMVEQLKAENQYYRQAYQTSKQSLQKVKNALDEQKQRRTTEKQLYQHEISTLKRKLSADKTKIKLGHIFTFPSFNQKGVSDMIVEVENQNSTFSKIAAEDPPESVNCMMSSLSINSK